MALKRNRRVLLGAPGLPTPALDLNYGSTMALAGSETFTRASTAWYFNSSGVLTSAATNAARFDYDPATLLPRGLLLEEQRINLFLNSAVGVTQSCTVAAVANTLSFYGTGTITLTGVSTAGPLVGTGATTRVSLTFTPTAGSLTLTVSGSVTNVQLEAGAYVTSPIVTVGSTVTRAVDLCTILTSAIPSYSASAGTLVHEARALHTTIPTMVHVQIDDGTSANRILIQKAAVGQLRARTTISSGVVVSLVGTLPADGAVGKFGFAFRDLDYAFSVNGATPSTAATAAGMPTGLTRLAVGGTGPGAQWVQRLRYYNARLSDAGLQRLTT